MHIYTYLPLHYWLPLSQRPSQNWQRPALLAWSSVGKAACEQRGSQNAPVFSASAPARTPPARFRATPEVRACTPCPLANYTQAPGQCARSRTANRRAFHAPRPRTFSILLNMVRIFQIWNALSTVEVFVFLSFINLEVYVLSRQVPGPVDNWLRIGGIMISDQLFYANCIFFSFIWVSIHVDIEPSVSTA